MQEFEDLDFEKHLYIDCDGRFTKLETCIQHQKQRRIPNPGIWNKINNCVSKRKKLQYKTPLLPTLSHAEIKNIERLLPKKYGIPKDLYRYLTRVSREIIITDQHVICEIGANILDKIIDINEIDNNPLNKLNLKGVLIGRVNHKYDGYGNVIICLNKGLYYGTIWVEYDEYTNYEELCLESFILNEFFNP